MVKNALLLVFSSLVFLAAVELFLRFIGPGDNIVYSLDDRLIFRPIPGRKFRYVQFPENGGAEIITVFNEQALRGPNFSTDGFTGTRVAVFGDSFIQASYTKFENTFAHKLEALLEKGTDRPVRVLNAGVNGYGPDQYLRRLEEELPGLNPDLAIVAVFADNDFGDLVRNKIFRIDANGQLAPNAFVIGQEVLDRQHELERLHRSLALHRAFVDPSTVKRDLRILIERKLGIETALFADIAIETAYRTETDVPWIDTWLARARKEYRETVIDRDPVIRLDSIRSDHYDADLALSPGSPPALYKVRLMDLVLSQTAEDLRSRHIPLFVLIIPSPIDACEGYDWQVDPKRYPEYDRETLTRVVEHIVERSGTDYLNLFPHFSGRDCNRLFHHHGNNHWNEAGQLRAATLVSDYLIGNKLVPSGR